MGRRQANLMNRNATKLYEFYEAKIDRAQKNGLNQILIFLRQEIIHFEQCEEQIILFV